MRKVAPPVPACVGKDEERLNSAWSFVVSVIAFHEKAGRSQVDSLLFFVDKGFFSRRVATVAMLPSALSRSDSFRSVHVGRSRFSRCCHLFIALWFCSCRVEPGPGD